MIISRIDGGVLSIRGTTLAGISPAEIDVPQPLRLNGARRDEHGSEASDEGAAVHRRCLTVAGW
jgi:hypothetical protein